MSSDMRCPECGDTDVECVETAKVHYHVCYGCGYSIVYKGDEASQ